MELTVTEATKSRMQRPLNLWTAVGYNAPTLVVSFPPRFCPVACTDGEQP